MIINFQKWVYMGVGSFFFLRFKKFPKVSKRAAKHITLFFLFSITSRGDLSPTSQQAKAHEIGKVPPVRSVYNGTESLSFLDPNISDIVLTELKGVKTLSACKSGIKN